MKFSMFLTIPYLSSFEGVSGKLLRSNVELLQHAKLNGGWWKNLNFTSLKCVRSLSISPSFDVQLIVNALKWLKLLANEMRCLSILYGIVWNAERLSPSTQDARTDDKSFAIQPNTNPIIWFWWSNFVDYISLSQTWKKAASCFHVKWIGLNLYARTSSLFGVNKYPNRVSSTCVLTPSRSICTHLRHHSRTSQVMECEWRKRETNDDRREKKSKKKIIKIKQMCCKRRRSACNCISDNTSYCLPVGADSVCVSCLRVCECVCVCVCPRCSRGYSSPSQTKWILRWIYGISFRRAHKIYMYIYNFFLFFFSPFFQHQKDELLR